MGFLQRLFGSKPATPDLKEAFAAFLEDLAPHAREAFRPLTELRPAVFDAASKFGGYPYLRSSAEWPECPNCNTKMHLFLRVAVPAGDEPSISGIDGPSLEERLIVSWETLTDYPSWEDMQSLGVVCNPDLMEWMEEWPLEGDKLGGWPRWVQAAEWPQDPNSGTRMELLFQLDSEVNLAYMFGDAGIGHVTVSPDNPDTLGFGWACS